VGDGQTVKQPHLLYISYRKFLPKFLLQFLRKIDHKRSPIFGPVSSKLFFFYYTPAYKSVSLHHSQVDAVYGVLPGLPEYLLYVGYAPHVGLICSL
jgi:hypothetical protein